MFLAHMPAGYMLGRLLLTQFRLGKSKTILFLSLGLLGSVFPDLDMFYFYFIDQQQHSHHSYWTHIPFFWLVLLCVSYSIACIFKSRIFIAASTIFISCIFLHLLLDTFAGGIQWLYPFSSEYFRLFTIPARHNFWVLNYVLHWTAIVELSIIVLAFVFHMKTKSAI